MVPCRPLWADPDNGYAGVSGLIVLVHEARHIERPDLIHACDDAGLICLDAQNRSGTCPRGFGAFAHDPSLEYGGAWAAHYWAYRWLAEHSGDWLGLENQARASQGAENVHRYHFCNNRSER